MNEQNRALFDQMNQPFPSSADADAALKAFADDIAELRKKHKIANLMYVVGGSMIDSQGERSEFVTSGFFGDQLRAESMAAWSLGMEQARRQEVIASMLRQGGAISKGRREP